ncbi:MAG: ATP-binding protein, partial [Bacilli bacterium]|nr:ATP-binding protein [Bacilli bacterium]
MNKNEMKYNEEDIQVLEGLEAIRKRPGMYIGTTSGRGLHHLVWEIVDNAIDEALAGYCDDIEIIINKDNSITIKDDGRGIPTGIHSKTGLSTVETVYTVLHAGGKFGGGGYKVSGGLHGVGASVVNALSSFVEVTIYQNEKVHFIRFENGGKALEPLKVIAKCDKERTGTTVTFKPDPEIFQETTIFDYEILKNRVRELAFLNKGLRIILVDDREIESKKEEFLYNGGLKEYIIYLNRNHRPIHEEIVYIEGVKEEISIEVSFQYNESYNNSTLSFVNNINTGDGGTHEEGVRNSLTRIINNYARKNKFLKENDESLTGDDVREGLTIVISCKHPNPQFEGQTKGRLGNTEVRKIASDIFGEGLERFLMENPDVAKQILDKSLMASHARLAAKKARELSRTKGGLDLTNQWGKLADCSSKDPLERELFIVEGDSAMGSSKLGRNPKTQAILPIKGKILNVEKSRLDKILGNEEIRSLITAFGTSIGDEF